MNANSLETVAIITGLVLVMVFVLPLLDRRACRRLGLSLTGGVSDNPRAETLLRARQGILLGAFCVYLAVLAYLVFFSRGATREHQVHVALYEDFRKAVASALTDVPFVGEDITQVYMNIMLFVPMGYLLPYLFGWFRARMHYRPVLACFLIALAIENLQLVFRRGFYDLDDLVSNTLGGFLGQMLFISVAYVVTHPNWREELKTYRRWKRHARTRTLYPFARRMRLSRTVLRASGEEAIWDFYVMKLGFRLTKQLVPLDTPGTDMFLTLGRMQLLVRCDNREEVLPPQELTLAVQRLNPVLRRLRASGIEPGEIAQDPCTGLRCVAFRGPDDVLITVIETP
ncbi:MAG: VanZ family protein [Clostridia bacterium]|nr:VanZ family protein [Clostridia bacterium]